MESQRSTPPQPQPQPQGMPYARNDGREENDNGEGNARLQDIKWISALSEPEIDFLISLKELAIRRAKNAGHKDLGDKFDLQMLRTLGYILLEYFKNRVQETTNIPDSAKIVRLINECGLSFPSSDGKSFANSSIEGTDSFSFVTPRRKRMWDGLCEDMSNRHKRQKTTDADQ